MSIRGELDLIGRVRKHVAAMEQEVVCGIGDDCAVFKLAPDSLNLVTTDTLVEGIHFDTAWHPPEMLGRKTAAVNLSDIAAMGGVPRYATISLALSPEREDDWLDMFFDGFLAALSERQVLLVGGDTVASGRDSVFTVTLIGQVEVDQVLYRSGAQIDDLVWVSGTLGDAAAGLGLCRKGVPVSDNRWQPLLKAHLDPAAQVELGRVLAKSGMVHAMLDVSDGIATDLAHLCTASGVGAEIGAASLPHSALLEEAAVSCGCDWLDWVVSGGEDYQLIFTSSEAVKEALPGLVKKETGCDIACVGRIVAGSGVVLCLDGLRRDISYQGYEHFK